VPSVPLCQRLAGTIGEGVDASHRLLLISVVCVGNREKVDVSHRFLLASVVYVGHGENVPTLKRSSVLAF